MPSLIKAYEDGTLAELRKKDQQRGPLPNQYGPAVKDVFIGDRDDLEPWDDEEDDEDVDTDCQYCHGSGHSEMDCGRCPECLGEGANPLYW